MLNLENLKNYKHHISVDVFEEKNNSGKYILLDLRTAQEQELYGVIQNTQEYIDVYLPDAQEKLGDLDINKKYLFYCWHGVRSAQVINLLKEQGFENIYDLVGGTDIWEKQGKKLTKK